MEFRKIIILLSVTVSIMLGVLLGVSYGWYAYANAESSIIGSTIKEAPMIVFAQTENIIVKQNMPIYDEDKYLYGNKNSFTITLGKNLENYETGIEIVLNDIKMDESLKIENYKYELLENKQVISSGNFSQLGENTQIKLIPLTIMTPEVYPYTYAYELYIWLSEDNTNQNELMNKQFGAAINVNSAIKK